MRVFMTKAFKLSTCLPQAFLLLMLSFFATGCGNNEEKHPDVSGVKVEMKTYRLEQELAALDTNAIAPGLTKLADKYPDFLDFYLDTLMGFGIGRDYTDTNHGINKGLRMFLTHKDYRGLFDTVAKHYPDTKDEDAELQKGFQFMKHYYPGYKEPKVIYLVSGLNNWGAFTYGEQIVGVGLDMFLGASYPYYRSVGIPDYMGNKLEASYMPVAVFKAIYESHTPFIPDSRTLLNMMIQKGKEMYVVSKILPFKSEAVLMGYTDEQAEWCKKNEALVYNFFIHENLLYEKNWQKILRYISDGPTSAGIPNSPGNIGTWLGWQIVKSYMNAHSEMTLLQLAENNTEDRVFLQESGYKPK